MATRQRIAVLGGGLGSLSTIFHLTEQDGWQDKFDITIYQQGWRLGGKCASGRDMRPGYGARILEHGLHLFAGFYHYSFAMLRRCYEALDRPEGHPNRRVWDAFIGLDTITLMDKVPCADGGVQYEPWALNFEPVAGHPGDSVEPPAITDLMRAILQMAARWDPAARTTPTVDLHHGVGGFFKSIFDDIKDTVEDAVIDLGSDVARGVLEDLAAHDADPKRDGLPFVNKKSIDRMMMTSFLARSVVRGIIIDDVLTKGFDQLDHEEFSDWIQRHAEAVARADPRDAGDPVAAAKALVASPVVRGSYDYTFGYVDGDPGKRSQAAGTTLRGMLRFTLAFKGHLFYMMRGGMGDVVIAPLYLELLKRGVKFEFFSRVERLVPGADGIESIEISPQAKPKSGAYQPLVSVPLAGWSPELPLPCWPSEPLWEQLEDGAALQASGMDFEAPWSQALPVRTLVRGQDFDQIVLGIPIGELKRVCADLPARQPKWGVMFDKIATTRTIATQLWARRTMADLGVDEPGRALTGYAQPLSVWADMTHLLSRETWEGAGAPQSATYLCGQYPGGAISTAQEAADLAAESAAAVRTWFATDAAAQWPAVKDPNSAYGVDTGVLCDPAGGVGDARVLAQYWRVNATPSELYVQASPGSLYARLRANESGFDNLFLCGDWTKNGLNAGAAEAAVMSGVICANALVGNFAPIAGEIDIAP